MAVKNVVVQDLVQALNIDALNRSFVAKTDVENGAIFACGPRSKDRDKAEVFDVAEPQAGALTGLWMAYEPEVNNTVAGENKIYRGLNPDPRDFTNVAGTVFSGFKPMPGDIITLTGGAVLAGTYEAGTTNYVNATAGANTLTWGNEPTEGAFSMKLIEPAYISLTDGSVIGGIGRVPAYRFEVVNN